MCMTQVGINVPVPSPMPFSSFNGPKVSFAGDLNFCGLTFPSSLLLVDPYCEMWFYLFFSCLSITGKSGVHFYTQIKMVAQQWRDLPSLGASSGLHLLSETDMTSWGVSSALPPSSEKDSPYQRVSPAMSQESEGNSPNHAILLSVTATSERDLSNPAITSVFNRWWWFAKSWSISCYTSDNWDGFGKPRHIPNYTIRKRERPITPRSVISNIPSIWKNLYTSNITMEWNSDTSISKNWVYSSTLWEDLYTHNMSEE